MAYESRGRQEEEEALPKQLLTGADLVRYAWHKWPAGHQTQFDINFCMFEIVSISASIFRVEL